jgi:aryl-alcohol dehydrogenase-like predicted oxidoreductase
LVDTARIPMRSLGAGGLTAGAVGLGCLGMSWAYGVDDRDDERSVAVIRRALELGATLIDTSDIYGPFTHEELVGRALQGCRDDAVLATKGGLVVDDGYATRHDGSPAHIASAVEASLKRLNTDVIDLYQLHRADPSVPLEDTWGAMARLVQQGKVRAIGLSEASVEQLELAHGIHPVASVQSELSLWTRDRLRDVLPWCRANGVAFIPFAPLGRGFLTGKLARADFDERDFRASFPRFTPEAMDANQAIVAKVQDVAETLGATPAQVALAWILAQGDQVIPIPGTSKLHRLEENVAAANLELGPEQLAELDRLPEAEGERYPSGTAGGVRPAKSDC